MSSALVSLLTAWRQLEEIAVENRDVFVEAGGEDYSYIPALNHECGSHSSIGRYCAAAYPGLARSESLSGVSLVYLAANKQSQELAKEKGAKL